MASEIDFIVCAGGVCKTVKGYMSFGKANVFMTVAFPSGVNFLCCHCFKHFLNSSSVGI